MKLFQSIFCGREAVRRYPETLIEMAIERAVDGTDPRLRLVPGCRKRLRGPVIHAIDQVVALVDGIPTPVSAGSDGYRNDVRLAALFASTDEMQQLFGRDRALSEYLSGTEGQGAERVTALLLARREERNIFGMGLVGDQVRCDVAQVSVVPRGTTCWSPEQMRRSPGASLSAVPSITGSPRPWSRSPRRGWSGRTCNASVTCCSASSGP